MNKKTLKVVGLLAFATFLLTACSTRTVRGSGDLISETRAVSNFDRVNLNGSGEVIITQGEEESLVVETDDNIMEYVTTQVRGGTLELGFDSTKVMNIDPTQLTFTLHLKELAGLDIDGSGKYIADDLYSDTADIKLDGSGRVTVWVAESLDARVNGSGSVSYYGTPTVNSTGSGSGTLNSLGEK